jgi:1-acyl-sn-glycerol-3-phosphate acyltransferase
MSAPVREDDRSGELSLSRLERAHRRARGSGVNVPLYALVRLLVAPLLRLWFRVRISDAENIPPEGAAIIAPNHKSFLDAFFLAIATRRHVRYMAKTELFRGPLGWLFPRLGAFPVRRGEADAEAIETARLILEQGGLLVMFPEGTRVEESDALGSPHHGAGRLALETGASVIPAAISGTGHLWLGPIPKPHRVQLGLPRPDRPAATRRPTRRGRRARRPRAVAGRPAGVSSPASPPRPVPRRACGDRPRRGPARPPSSADADTPPARHRRAAQGAPSQGQAACAGAAADAVAPVGEAPFRGGRTLGCWGRNADARSGRLATAGEPTQACRLGGDLLARRRARAKARFCSASWSRVPASWIAGAEHRCGSAPMDPAAFHRRRH